LCSCGREHQAARPAGVPDAPVTIGPNLRALAVYLVVFQHVPVGRCRDLIAEVTGAAVSAGFIHSCLRAAANRAAGVIKLIAALIIAARVAGFDETKLRVWPAGSKKYVLGAFTGQYSLLFPGVRTLESFRYFGILPAFGGEAVSDHLPELLPPGLDTHRRAPDVLRSSAQGPRRRRRDLPGRDLAGPGTAGAARPDPRVARRPQHRPGPHPRRSRGPAGP
jgi:hypothetical protein